MRAQPLVLMCKASFERWLLALVRAAPFVISSNCLELTHKAPFTWAGAVSSHTRAAPFCKSGGLGLTCEALVAQAVVVSPHARNSLLGEGRPLVLMREASFVCVMAISPYTRSSLCVSASRTPAARANGAACACMLPPTTQKKLSPLQPTGPSQKIWGALPSPSRHTTDDSVTLEALVLACSPKQREWTYFHVMLRVCLPSPPHPHPLGVLLGRAEHMRMEGGVGVRSHEQKTNPSSYVGLRQDAKYQHDAVS